MSSVDRDSSREREMVVKHQYSFSSDGSRMSIPMWDSSDPERAPPPLPLNPNPNSPSVRPNTSANIAAAARAFEEKARESAPASSYTVNPMPQKSPERSLIKGAHHRRLQSLQPPNVKDLRSHLDGVRTPERSPERPGTRNGTPLFGREIDRDYLGSPGERSPSRIETPTPTIRDFAKEASSVRGSSRPPPRAILGENTPPTSSTMLALQNLQLKDFDKPLSDITNGSSPRKPPGIDDISHQIRSLTTIAEKLKDDMEQLSRRSKDNAVDLMGLKDAASARDEDIRKSLKELVSTMNNSPAAFLGMTSSLSRSGSAASDAFTTARDPHTTPQAVPKSFTLPRIPSPGTFFEDVVGSPNPYSVEGAASVAMLEKIIREMVTKEGQERLLKNLSQLLEKAREDSGETAKKVTELVEFIKTGPQSQALIRHPSSADSNGPVSAVDLDGTGSIASKNFQMPHLAHLTKPYTSPKAADFVSEEMLKLLRRIKDSVSESGGMTSEVKALVRDLRSEVLGMGREIGRKLEDSETTSDRTVVDSKEDVGQIVRDSLQELRDQMDRVIREKRRQSSSTVMSRSTVNNQEVYDVVKHALAERGLDQVSAQAQQQGIDKESILEAVKEAYEAYKPEIELQQFGLEREEILQCLKEGLEEYRQSAEQPPRGIEREELMETVQEALMNFNPPRPTTEADEVRQEMMAAFRDCLDEFKPSLNDREASNPRELEINRDDLFDAVRAGLEGSRTPIGAQVLDRLHDILTDMRSEFKSYSSANGRDTEQVLDAMKDGLETLRTEIESYVDKAQDVTGKDEIIETIRNGFESLRGEYEQSVLNSAQEGPSMSKADILAYIKSEFEHLHETIGPNGAPGLDKDEMASMLKSCLSELKAGVQALEEEDGQDVKQMLMSEFERLQESLAETHASNKDEILSILKEESGSIVSRSEPSSQSSEDLIAYMKEEFDHLRETLAATLINSSAAMAKDDILDAIRESTEGIQSKMQDSEQGLTTEKLTEIHEEIKSLQDSITSSMVMGQPSAGKEEILDAIRTGLEGLDLSRGTDNEAQETLRADLDSLRQMISQGITLRSSGADTEEVLDAVRLGLDDLRSHLEKKIDNPERHMSATNELLDVLNDGLDSLRADVTKIVDKPVDMTVSYEILETLKDGLSRLREDMNQLKGVDMTGGESAIISREVVLADDPDAPVARDAQDSIPSAEVFHRQDFEKIEVALAQIQIKVEAMDANIQNPIPAPPNEVTEDPVLKEDIASIEAMLKELQATVSVIASRDSEGKEDTEAIETLLRNTKAKLDDLEFPDLTTLASKEHLDIIEAGLKVVNDAVDGLAAKSEESGASKADVAVVEVLAGDIKAALEALVAKSEESGASKADVAVVEVLAGDIKTSLGEFKDIFTTKESEMMTKADLDVLGVLCTETKNKIEELKIPDSDSLPAKADVDQLRGLLHDFRESHDKMKESYEMDIAITAKAFDDRKTEAEVMVEKIGNVKSAMEEFKEELYKKLEEGLGMEGVKENVKSLEETIATNFSINADVKELVETVNREFERLQGAADGLKIDQDEKLATTLEKNHEIRDAVVEEVSKKLDERFDSIMAKYDDTTILAEASVKLLEEKATSQEELLSGAKAMTEDLNLTIATLGTALTSFQTTFTEVSEKASQDSQTVFSKVDEMASKLNDLPTDGRADHEETRSKVVETLHAVHDMQNEITEHHPKFMVTLQEVLALVNQHYEHSQKAGQSAQEQIKEATEAARANAEELKNSFTALPALLPPPPADPIHVEQYDDAQLHEKLDTLLGHANDTGESAAQLERLDQIHSQVMATAAEVTNFVCNQTKLITEGHESREKEAEELAIAIERRLVQKEQLESDVLELREDKESLRSSVEALKAERDALAAEKYRLNADVAAFQTALNIRREELQSMDAKADALERRILEGIMDHSRAMLFAKSAKSQPERVQKPQRTVSNASHSTLSSLPPPSAAANGLHFALNSKRPNIRRNAPQQAARRILSLSQITGNVPTGAQAYAASPQTSFNNIKRSQSVKHQYGGKAPWAGKRAVSDVANKENGSLKEESEHSYHDLSVDTQGDHDVSEAHELTLASPHELDQDDLCSDAGTERRHSYDSHMEGITPGAESDRRLSYETNGSEHTYGSSYASGSSSGTYRSTSYGSTMRSTLGADTVIDEEDEDQASFRSASEDGDPEDEEVDHTSRPASPKGSPVVTPSSEEVEAKDVLGDLPSPSKPNFDTVGGSPRSKRFIYDSDSGLGTELPTANAGSESEADYFRRQAEEESTLSGN
ncbi:hypothetical protein EJ05DRAFT_541787 [Pseudovirgaria hyperparasitica]|uniref:Chromosome segregation ATPase family protein n=1 Tax=Pseudovirgaria hyperparasitica TaxID=470096 RepID=A0A6A6VT94_9PEZI|nr:uncharacterized protein EJ05DRAFT_541787 [Pseudovirgaria hyperparasitica]KAF2753802.1 hypothetical protein EJ05DRAFT_541787 [Pseudovirgaria hyperparasitica]